MQERSDGWPEKPIKQVDAIASTQNAAKWNARRETR